jgi:hypothetical protein
MCLKSFESSYSETATSKNSQPIPVTDSLLAQRASARRKLGNVSISLATTSATVGFLIKCRLMLITGPSSHTWSLVRGL